MSTKGKRISVKDYFFVKFPRAELLKVEDVVDLERSKIDYRRDGQFKKVWELRFRKSPERDLFFLDCISLLGVAFCSERFTEGAKRFRPRGASSWSCLRSGLSTARDRTLRLRATILHLVALDT
ncbi:MULTISPECIES: hypothetical protein [unclassified Streptomyces]|uniref:hypothetical protein n=1 Tax=unclassified Streptomyces TaxID=2593676 RepID=UPI002F90B14A